MKITFIGGGNMAGALIGGLIQRGFHPGDIHVVEINADARATLTRAFKLKTYAGISAEAVQTDLIVLAVKPQQLCAVAGELKPLLRKQLVISIAAGVRAQDLARWLGDYARLVRAMPNTPALVRAGVTGLYALPEVSSAERGQAQQVMEAVGACVWLEEEAQMDAVTAVSGSGPAYVFYFIEALEAAALALGLSPAQGRELALATFLGAAQLARQSHDDPATLRAKVTSKGGTTERAILSLEQADVKNLIQRAVLSAAERSRELGDELGKLG
ncbi:MAG: pyrroline-5-carboxylate reductase [Burkholderiales bacterium]|nr:pyrroline-5-carboxylate reductase [Burkholderiales bacterium]